MNGLLALEADRLVSRSTEIAAAVSAALDGFAAAIFLVDLAARIIYANANGWTLLSASTVVRECAGRLTAIDPAADRGLRRSLLAFRGEPFVTAQPMAVPLRAHAGAGTWLAHVTAPIPRRRDAVASVVIREATIDLTGALAAVASTYKLTPGESRALAAIVDHGGVRPAARALGLSDTTVKSHLRQIFAKTGTNRQADLVRLAAGFTCPVA
jgi:DNA-binding CsgD family transcriptional regulator